MELLLVSELLGVVAEDLLFAKGTQIQKQTAPFEFERYQIRDYIWQGEEIICLVVSLPLCKVPVLLTTKIKRLPYQRLYHGVVDVLEPDLSQGGELKIKYVVCLWDPSWVTCWWRFDPTI